MTDDNLILPFQIEGQAISGRLVRASALVSDIMARHDYPEVVARLLAESVLLASLLGSSYKYDGRFIVQLQGKQSAQAKESKQNNQDQTSAITSLIAEYNLAGSVRACAQYNDALLIETLKQDSRPNALFGDNGYMALTIDPAQDKMERYQGIVALAGDTLTQAALDYFARSVQIATSLFIVARPHHHESGVMWQAAGLMLQQLPEEGGKPLSPTALDKDAWTRANLLLHTLTGDELLSPELSSADILWRLFNEDGVRIFEPRELQFACPCSRARVYDMLLRFSPDEKAELAEDDETEVKCEFCGEVYRFTPDELLVDKS